MPKLLTLDDIDPQGKTVIVRVDFNSPIDPKTKNVLDDTRIKRHAETTIKELIQKGAKVGILAHQGRRGEPDFTTLKQHAEILSKILKIPVKYVNDVFGSKAQEALKGLKSGEVLVFENVRTYADERTKGTPEKHAKSEMVGKLAPLADLFVNDAFAAAHRAHVSIVGFTNVLPSFAGRIMEKELKSLSLVLENPKKPCIFILGGAKADDALEISRYVLENKIADYVLTGGVAGHVFLAAKGIDLGESNVSFLKRKDLIRFIPGIKNLLKSHPDQILVPSDLALEINGKRKEIPIQKLPTNYPIFDVGSETVRIYSEIIRKANSIVLSGPLGVYEKEEFILGTKSIFQEVANSPGFSLAGGGHTVAALQELKISSKISYISTAGGALIDFLMGKELPGIVSLEKAVTKKL